ncbi:hypothetical protein PspLS_04026 [Pyricularia sp. CBS 133598]|nr:hypothetical protein PspLS_04026 [Pyricularia sp. CBS 133598]
MHTGCPSLAGRTSGGVPGYNRETATQQVWIKIGGKSYNVDILEPGQIGGPNLKADGSDKRIEGNAAQLKPALLSFKCYSWSSPGRKNKEGDKRVNDAKDIMFPARAYRGEVKKRRALGSDMDNISRVFE